MRFCVIDFETLFSQEYTLRRLSTEAYIRDSRFEAHGAAIKWSKDHAAKWYSEPELRFLLAQEDWSDTAIIAWHAAFDGLILNHHYKVNPKLLICPMSMYRLLYGNSESAALDAVRKRFGMSPKTTPYNLMIGRHWSEMDQNTRELVARGAEDEVESIWLLFQRFAKDFPTEEYWTLDTVIKMFTAPVLRGDIDLLAKIWTDENDRKAHRLADLGVTAADLQSADRFAELLRLEGVEPETKPSPANPATDRVYAFAKTDDFMRDLLEHDNPRVVDLAEARLGEKSTLMQTRAENLGWMARRGPLCVYLNYCGAGTLRISGGDRSNFANFKRQSALRKTILAPEGFVLAPIDSSQIELRVGHYLAGGIDEPVIRMLLEGRDPYAEQATVFYGEKIYKPAKDDPHKDEMEAKRGAGKQARLMCLYGSAGPKYRATAKAGLYGPPIDISLEEANRHVLLYRQNNPSVCALHTGYWAQASRMLARLAGGDPVQWGPLLVKDHKIYLPSGQMLVYDSLHYYTPSPGEPCRDFERNGYWRLKTRRGWKSMWGSKLVQNICEAVSRVIVSQAMNRITAMGYRVLNWPYDELLVLIPKDGKEAWHLERCMAEMKKAPAWLPDLPLDCESVMGERYAK